MKFMPHTFVRCVDVWLNNVVLRVGSCVRRARAITVEPECSLDFRFQSRIYQRVKLVHGVFWNLNGVRQVETGKDACIVSSPMTLLNWWLYTFFIYHNLLCTNMAIIFNLPSQMVYGATNRASFLRYKLWQSLRRAVFSMQTNCGVVDIC